jgi:GT2 family glycosyltransferase
MSRRTKVAIVIPVYNGRQHLPDLLSSLHQDTKARKGRHEGAKITQAIIVCDDASTDDSAAYLNENYSQVRVIQGDKNIGYAGNVNRGLKQAKSFDYAVVLNQDIVVSKNWLESLVEVMESDSQIAAAQPLVMHWKDKEKVQTWGNEIHFLMFGYSGGNLEMIDSPSRHSQGTEESPVNAEPHIRGRSFDQLRMTSPSEVTYTTGSAMIMRVSVLKEIGLLDEDLVMYHEDLEWCLRARGHGYMMMIVPEARVFHKYDFEKSIKKYFYMERNRFIVLFQYYKFLTILFILPPLVLMELGIMTFALLRGFWLQRLQAYFWLVIHWPKVFEKRQKTQRLRSVNDRELMKAFVGRIEYQEIDNPVLKYFGNPLMNAYWQVLKRIMWW